MAALMDQFKQYVTKSVASRVRVVPDNRHRCERAPVAVALAVRRTVGAVALAVRRTVVPPLPFARATPAPPGPTSLATYTLSLVYSGRLSSPLGDAHGVKGSECIYVQQYVFLCYSHSYLFTNGIGSTSQLSFLC